MCDCLKLNLGSFCHFDDERLAFEGPWRCDRGSLPAKVEQSPWRGAGQNLGQAPSLDGCVDLLPDVRPALCRAKDRNLADRSLRLCNRSLLSMLRVQPELDEAADGFGSVGLIGLFCCPGVHFVPEFGRQSDGRYRVLTRCRAPPFFS